MKMYRIASPVGTIAYRARKSVAIQEARAASRDQDGPVVVTGLEIRTDLPKALMIEAVLNGNGFLPSPEHEFIGCFRKGRVSEDLPA